MVATLFLLLFMFIVPKHFKKMGIKLIIENKRQGMILFLLSKILWWFIFLQICRIWIPDLYILSYLFMVAGMGYKFYKERKYLVYGLAKKPSH